MKKFLLIIIIAILALASWYIFFFEEGVTFSKETSIYKAVPIDAPAFIELKSINGIPLNNNVVLDLKKSGIFPSLFSNLELLDSLVSSSKEINNSVLNEPLIIAFTLEGRENLVPLIILKAETNNKRNSVIALINKLFPQGEYTSSKRPYNGRKIIGMKPIDSNKEFHYTHTNGLVIASPKSILVEQAIRQIESESILDDKGFTQVNRTASLQSKISFYINHKYFPQLIQNWLNPETKSEVNELGKKANINYHSVIERFGRYAAWSELDISVKDKKVVLNGVSIANDSLNNYLSVFQGQEPARFQADKVLPKRTAMFLSYTVSEKNAFFNNLEEYLQHNELFYKREEALKMISKKSGSNLENIFQSILEDEMAISFSEVPSDPQKKAAIFMLSTKGQSVAKEQMDTFLKKYAARNNINFNGLVSQFVIDRETKHSIYKFPYPSFPGIWLNGPFKAVKANYFTFWDNYLVFCNTRKGLQSIIHDVMLDATLAKDINYNKFKQNIENKANINFYFNTNLGFNIQKDIFSKEVSKSITGKEEQLRKAGPINWQVVNTKGLFFNNIYLNYSLEIKEDAKTTWQSNIESTATAKPQLAVNHNDPRNREIIIQDDNNYLHQITKDGRSRWSIKISGTILSEIFQIDYLRNGKYQYLFNTKDKIFLIDRNGNNVAPFPVKLRAEATNGMNVFDYDNTRKYRYFVAGIDKKIYVYDSKGAIVNGWKFGGTDHIVTKPVKHFRVAGKDYIVFKDKSKIYIQNRRGETRVKPGAQFENSENELVLNTKGTPKIIATSKTGEVYYLYFNGKALKKDVGKFSPKHHFAVDDLDGNGILDFVFADGKKLSVIDENRKKRFTKEFNSTISFQPNIYTFSSTLKKIGLVTKDSNKIYLVNPDGSLHNGFPLIGNSPFTIGKTTSGTGYFNLVVASQDGNIYNYRLD